MSKYSNSATVQARNESPSFFKNSCPGINLISEDREPGDIESRSHEGDRPGTEDVKRRRGGTGGYTCCVPECFSNSKRNPHLSFYNYPDGQSEEKKLLRKRWIHLVGRKDFKPTDQADSSCTHSC